MTCIKFRQKIVGLVTARVIACEEVNVASKLKRNETKRSLIMSKNTNNTVKLGLNANHNQTIIRGSVKLGLNANHNQTIIR
jgi:hypothetical protein